MPLDIKYNSGEVQRAQVAALVQVMGQAGLTLGGALQNFAYRVLQPELDMKRTTLIGGTAGVIYVPVPPMTGAASRALHMPCREVDAIISQRLASYGAGWT